MTEYEELRKEVEDLKSDVKELKGSVDSLLLLWQQAKGVVAFVKYTSYFVGAVASIWLFFKNYITIGVK